MLGDNDLMIKCEEGGGAYGSVSSLFGHTQRALFS